MAITTKRIATNGVVPVPVPVTEAAGVATTTVTTTNTFQRRRQNKKNQRNRTISPSWTTVLLSLSLFLALDALARRTTTTVAASPSSAPTSNRVVDAENGGDCFDTDPVNCPFWAATGECQSNKGYMHVHCKKSCDRCNIVRVKDRNEINRYMEEKKKELAEKRKLKDKAKEALQALEGGIGSSDGTATETSIGTENDNNNNSHNSNNKENKLNKLPPPTAETATITAAEATISNDGSVSSNKAVVGDSKQESKETVVSEPTTTAAATQKPTTGDQPNKIKNEIQNQNKKRAKIDAETGLECVDIHENCPFWAATGDCKTNRGFMSINCRLSCERCHIVRVNNNNDIHSYINRKAKETEKEREAQKQERVVRKILQGEL